MGNYWASAAAVEANPTIPAVDGVHQASPAALDAAPAAFPPVVVADVVADAIQAALAPQVPDVQVASAVTDPVNSTMAMFSPGPPDPPRSPSPHPRVASVQHVLVHGWDKVEIAVNVNAFLQQTFLPAEEWPVHDYTDILANATGTASKADGTDEKVPPQADPVVGDANKVQQPAIERMAYGSDSSMWVTAKPETPQMAHWVIPHHGDMLRHLCMEVDEHVRAVQIQCGGATVWEAPVHVRAGSGRQMVEQGFPDAWLPTVASFTLLTLVVTHDYPTHADFVHAKYRLTCEYAFLPKVARDKLCLAQLDQFIKNARLVFWPKYDLLTDSQGLAYPVTCQF